MVVVVVVVVVAVGSRGCRGDAEEEEVNLASCCKPRNVVWRRRGGGQVSCPCLVAAGSCGCSHVADVSCRVGVTLV